MNYALNLLLAIVIAAATGFGSAWLVVGEGWLLKTVKIGVWSAWPNGGLPAPDPYSRALVARTGQVPLGPGEGIAYFATRDSESSPIRGSCEYRLWGSVPASRLWTLEAVDAHGNVGENPARRYALTSRDVVFAPDGRIDIALSATARPGNWLPIPSEGALTLILRAYDVQTSNVTANAEVKLPALDRKGCP